MKEDIVKKESSIMVPFLVGGLVGAGIALLLAPKSGKELRKDIKDVASKTRNTIADAAIRTRDTIASTVERGKELYNDGTAAVKSAIDAGKMTYVEERDRHRHAA